MNNMKYKAIIFDFDGVLADTEKLHFQNVDYIAENYEEMATWIFQNN